jgi:hypothetical protein
VRKKHSRSANGDQPSRGRKKPFSVTHGAWCRQVRQRYSDLRTREGKQLHQIMSDLVADLGGPAELTAGQRLLLDNIKAKLIVLLQISKFVDQQDSVITSDGALLPCLGRGFTTYSESVRRDIEALYVAIKKVPPLSYEKALQALEGGKP